MYLVAFCALLFGLLSGPVSSFVVSSISCEYYNATCIKEAVLSNRTIKQDECYGVEMCPNHSVHTCYVVWSNTSVFGEDQDIGKIHKNSSSSTSNSRVLTHAHNSTLNVKMMGCFASAEGCNQESRCMADSNNPAARGGHLFCCCTGDMCNSDFKWLPKVTSEAPGTEVETSEPTGPDEDKTTLLPIMYALVPLIAVLVAIGAAFFVIRQRKVARYEAAGANNDEAGALVSDENSQLNMTQRNIELMEIKARGRFGAVWKGKFGYDMVAVKIFPLQDKNSWYAEQEIYNLPQMDHDNVLKFVGVEKRGENLQMEFWLITSFHEKGSLCDFLKSNVVSWEELCKIAETMARGLAHLHEELPKSGRQEMKPAIAHRDFKSKNVLIKSDMSACIADFGLALVFEPGKAVGDAHGQVGTRRYMAPEVLEGAINFSKDAFLRIDVYACGLVLWELASRCKLGAQPVNPLSQLIQNNNNDVTSLAVDEYKLPFEKEIASPTLEEMQKQVVTQKLRPHIKDSWRLLPGMASFCNTVEECWDHDAEARLSSSCIVERIKNLQQFIPNRVITEEQHLNTLNQTDDVTGLEQNGDITEMTPLYIQSPRPTMTSSSETNSSSVV